MKTQTTAEERAGELHKVVTGIVMMRPLNKTKSSLLVKHVGNQITIIKNTYFYLQHDKKKVYENLDKEKPNVFNRGWVCKW